MTSKEIRNQFIEFFKNKDHKYVPSAPVVPYDDPTLLFTNAGMNQFKDVFLGTGHRDYKRAANTQKCIRVSGKHNDLEEVGHDTYHHTFFEMLGNWSFGDYYKEDAIKWAWELLTEVWKLPKERLFATIYRTDDEAGEIWKRVTDINPAHVLKFDEKDNFWEMGDTGPCGPCSEIHINLSDNPDDGSIVNAGRPDCIEIWNLVFIQYFRDETGKLLDLPAKHVDTGMGFERVCAVIQGKNSNYDSDVFTPLLDEISKLSGVPYGEESVSIAMRVIADHVRTLSFAIADGAVPGNDGRGYVLRRLLRRAARYGRKLNLNEPFLYKLTETVSAMMGETFPEIVEKKEYVQKIIKLEEESFNRTLDRGIELFEKIIKSLSEQGIKEIPGADAFKLYDTFGFPLDLTQVMAREQGFDVNELDFAKFMTEQKERAREATKQKLSSVNTILETNDLATFGGEDVVTEFTGYKELITVATIKAVKKDGHTDLVLLDKTPFYAESGGQVSDEGYLQIGEAKIKVANLIKVNNKIIHVTENLDEIAIAEGMTVTAVVDRNRRWDIMRNHSATHFLHTALRKVLGTHVQQSGSYVGADRLRFDFTHFAKVTPEEILEVEAIVNEQIRNNLQLSHHLATPIEDAKKMGALMFFGDKYGDFVNVVQFENYTMEFCGGTHVHNSSEIGMVKVVSETSIASGVRRLEAVTGAGVEKYILEQAAKIKETNEKVVELHDVAKKLEKEIAELKFKEKLSALPKVLSSGKVEYGVTIFTGKLDAENMDELKQFGDELRNKMGSGIGLLIAAFEEKVGLVCVVSDDLIKDKKLSAGSIVGDCAKLLGGGGGGRPHLATAGAKDASKIDEVLSNFTSIISKYFN